MFKTSLIIMAGMLVSACAPTQEKGPETCPKSQFSGLIGTDINAAIFPLTLTYRTIYPGDVVTMDHAPERLNIAVDDAGNVTALTCG